MAEFLKDIKLVKREGEEYKTVDAAAHLNGKVVALYFSAHWCPPCRMFTPVLKDFYEHLIEANDAIEIVFVSFDRSDADLKSYMQEAHGNWCAIPYGEQAIKDLAAKYGVNGIPALVVIKPDGTAVVENGRADVQGQPPDKTFASWKEKCGV